MPPYSGGICGRLTSDLPPDYLQGGVQECCLAIPSRSKISVLDLSRELGSQGLTIDTRGEFGCVGVCSNHVWRHPAHADTTAELGSVSEGRENNICIFSTFTLKPKKHLPLIVSCIPHSLDSDRGGWTPLLNRPRKF